MWRERFCRPGRGTIPMIVAGMLALVVMGCSESGGLQAAASKPVAQHPTRSDVLRLTTDAMEAIGLKTEVVARAPLYTPLQVSGRVTY
ncbi:MAG TPA: hypothetical protein VJO34_14780, partial [Methylomirabilota bacterium]|nr:hypothetical protein [Methylomirabilota bacterium]